MLERLAAKRRQSRSSPPPRPRVVLQTELLERRDVPTTVTVQADVPVRPAPLDTNYLGANIALFTQGLSSQDNSLQSTTPVVQAANLGLFRLGSDSENENAHFNQAPAAGFLSNGQMLEAAEAFGGDGVITLNVLHGSPQEAAAYLAYVNAPVGATPVFIGSGGGTNWQTSAVWANLRAAAPLAQDDGLNFLRLNHPAPFGFKYFEVGNETYFSNITPSAYITFVTQFASFAHDIDPSISIGLNVGSPDESTGLGQAWTQPVLQAAANAGFVPGFLSDHDYVYDTGSENDNLLLHSVDSPHPELYSGNNPTLTPFSGPRDFPTRGAEYRTDLTNAFGAAGANVELIATEFNSSAATMGFSKQLTSLVNGLYVADAVGSLLDSGYSHGIIWDLRNGYETPPATNANLYGWRHGGDLGILGNDTGTALTNFPNESHLNEPYPSYYGLQLATQIVQAGDTVVQASSDDPANLSAYAVVEPNGHLGLLLVNKVAVADPNNPPPALNVQFQVNGFSLDGSGTLWQYGVAEDNRQRDTGSSSLTTQALSLGVTDGSSFQMSLPAYSMTVLDLTPVSSSPISVVPPVLVSPPSQPALMNVTSSVSLTPIPPPRHHHSNPLVRPLTLRNNGGLLHGPLFVILRGLNPKVHLKNATGTTQSQGHLGDPYLRIEADQLAAGASLELTLLFSNPHHRSISFTPEIFAGSGTP